MKVLILAAGYGTRLYPYTKNFPKPLLKVNKKPIIEYLLDKLAGLKGLSKVVVVTNGRYFNHFKKWRSGLKIKNKIRIVNDLTKSAEDKLGAIRDMALVFSLERADDFLVLGGDNFFKEPLGEFIHYAKKRTPAITLGVFDVKDRTQAKHYGVVKLDRKDRVVEFEEKPAYPKTTLVGMCLYYFPKNKLGLVKKYLADPGNYSDAVGAYIKWLCQNDKVCGYLFDKLWFDIGHIHTYQKLNKLCEKGEEKICKNDSLRLSR